MTAKLAALSLCLASASIAQDRIKVFVSAPMREGFVDTSKEIQDSVKDVRGSLQSRLLGTRKIFEVVDVPEQADIVLTVVTRGMDVANFGQRTTFTQYYKNAELTTVPITHGTNWVATVMQVGNYRKEFVGADAGILAPNGLWTKCADNIAKNIKSWVEANRVQINQLRSKQQ